VSEFQIVIDPGDSKAGLTYIPKRESKAKTVLIISALSGNKLFHRNSYRENDHRLMVKTCLCDLLPSSNMLLRCSTLTEVIDELSSVT